MRIKAALLAMGLVSCGLAQAALTSGTYVTEGKGNNGPVVVETTIENGAITKIRVLKSCVKTVRLSRRSKRATIWRSTRFWTPTLRA